MKVKLFCAAATLTTVAFLLSAPVAAQWLNYKTPGIPLTPDGKPDLSAPVPRTADGKPDLSGIWRAPRNSVYPRNIAADLKPSEIQPWAQDTLVVTTAGFNDRTCLDFVGHPHSEALRTTERFHRRDFGHMDFEMTLEDPKAFTKPITFKADKTLVADTELLETICEYEQHATHLVGGNRFRLTPETLAKYAGPYEFAPGREAVITLDGEIGRAHV